MPAVSTDPEQGMERGLSSTQRYKQKGTGFPNDCHLEVAPTTNEPKSHKTNSNGKQVAVDGRDTFGKTVVSSSMIDSVAADLNRRLKEVPVGFKWFVESLIDGTVGLCGEECRFRRLDFHSF